MDIENLVAMANQIGSFYETMPDRAKALTEIAEHIKKFWEPRMRREFLAHIDAADQQDPQLTPVVRESIRLNRALL